MKNIETEVIVKKPLTYLQFNLFSWYRVDCLSKLIATVFYNSHSKGDWFDPHGPGRHPKICFDGLDRFFIKSLQHSISPLYPLIAPSITQSNYSYDESKHVRAVLTACLVWWKSEICMKVVAMYAVNNINFRPT